MKEREFSRQQCFWNSFFWIGIGCFLIFGVEFWKKGYINIPLAIGCLIGGSLALFLISDYIERQKVKKENKK